jgi:phage shock protein E
MIQQNKRTQQMIAAAFMILVLILTLVYVWAIRPARPMTVAEARDAIHHHMFGAIVDVRTDAEYNAGHHPDAIHIPVQTIQSELPHVIPDRRTPILFYCRTGHRAAIAARTAMSLGYQNVRYLNAGSYTDLL